MLNREYFDNVARKLGLGNDLNDSVSETSPIISISTNENYSLGSVGKPLKNLKIKVIEKDENDLPLQQNNQNFQIEDDIESAHFQNKYFNEYNKGYNPKDCVCGKCSNLSGIAGVTECKIHGREFQFL